MKKLKFIFLLLLTYVATLQAEEKNIPSYLLKNRAISVGIGSVKEHDSYLSPLLYRGVGLTVMSENLKYFNTESNKFSWYSEGVFQLSIVENPAKNAGMTPFLLRYFLGAHYHIRPVQNMNILVGGLWNMDLGGRLQTRNQNNPFSLNWNTNIWISAMVYYHVPLKKRTLTFREHFSMPFIGVMFSPHYGQTYYEIFSLGDTDDVINLTSFGERVAWRNKLSMDLPVSFCTLRFGFLAERIATKVNNLETRNTNLSFLLGLVYNFSSFRGNQPISKNFHNPTE